MHFLYNIAIICYGFLIRLASIYNSKAKHWILGRKNWKKNLPKFDDSKLVYWFHCASLGEFDQGIPVMKELKNKIPSAYILVTFFSPSGMLHYHKRIHEADHVMYLPLDTRLNVNDFLDYFKPEKIFFIKYEFWANYLFQSKKRGIEVYSVSANFRANQLYFKWYGVFFRKILRHINHFFVQTEGSKTLLNSIGINSVTVVGDTRIDQVIDVRNNMFEQVKNQALEVDFHKVEKFINGKKAIIIGSSWPKEEELIFSFILCNPTIKFIIAPHDISERHISFIVNKLGDKCLRFTNYNGEISNINCLILDTIGHLSKAYFFGDIALIGGGFTGKLHNILEPLSFGLPVLFGPKHHKFPEAELFKSKGLVFEFHSASELEDRLTEIMLNIDTLQNKIENTMNSFQGVSKQIIELSIKKCFYKDENEYLT